jgi:tight adherence protein B
LVVAAAVAYVAYTLAVQQVEQDEDDKKISKVLDDIGGKTTRSARIPGSEKKGIQQMIDEIAKDRQTEGRQKVPLRLKLRRAGLNKLNTNNFYIICAGIGFTVFIAFLSLGVNVLICAVAAAAAGYWLPEFFINKLTDKRYEQFLEEFPNTLDIITRSIKSGLTLIDGVKVASTEAAEPIKSEFASIVEQINVGMQLTECFDRVYHNIPLKEVKFLRIAIAIQQQTGAAPVEVLDNLANTLRARKKFAATLKTKTAEPRTTAKLATVIPFAIGGILQVISPGYLDPLFNTELGKSMLMITGVWLTMGIFVMVRMAKIKV